MRCGGIYVAFNFLLPVFSITISFEYTQSGIFYLYIG